MLSTPPVKSLNLPPLLLPRLHPLPPEQQVHLAALSSNIWLVFLPRQKFVVHRWVKVGVKGWEVVPGSISCIIFFLWICLQSFSLFSLKVFFKLCCYTHAFLCLVSFLLVTLALGPGDLGNYCRHSFSSFLCFLTSISSILAFLLLGACDLGNYCRQSFSSFLTFVSISISAFLLHGCLAGKYSFTCGFPLGSIVWTVFLFHLSCSSFYWHLRFAVKRSYGLDLISIAGSSEI